MGRRFLVLIFFIQVGLGVGMGHVSGWRASGVEGGLRHLLFTSSLLPHPAQVTLSFLIPTRLVPLPQVFLFPENVFLVPPDERRERRWRRDCSVICQTVCVLFSALCPSQSCPQVSQGGVGAGLVMLSSHHVTVLGSSSQGSMGKK